MRGQRLFVRPLGPLDEDAVREFLARHSAASTPPPAGLAGKLVGDLVAILGFTLLPCSLRIDDLVVRDDLRRKRVGRFMIGEAAKLAAKMDRPLLVVERIVERPGERVGERVMERSGTADEFLRRVGFKEEDKQWIRRVR